jgi:HEAT repeat protein
LDWTEGNLEAEREFKIILHDHGTDAAADCLTRWKDKKLRGQLSGESVSVLGMHLARHDLVHRAGLRLAEVRALRLYTGPMFRWYNDVLRFRTMKAWPGYDGPALKPGQCWKDICDERKIQHPFVTTLHVLNSAILKVAKVQQVEKVYRGIGGGVLPESFIRSDKMGVRGGIELGFMSTTRNREVAMDYAGACSAGGERPSVVFELQMGMIGRGAAVQWVSQFPEEEEILFAPLTALEVVGAPTLEGSTVVVPLRMNCNLHDLTIEELTAKMRKSHMDLVGMILSQMEQALEQVEHKGKYLAVMRAHEQEMYAKMTEEEMGAKREEEIIASMKGSSVCDLIVSQMTPAEPPAAPLVCTHNRGQWFNRAEHYCAATKLALDRKYEACCMLVKATADFCELSNKGRRMVLATCMDVDDNGEVCLYGSNTFEQIAKDGDLIYDFDVDWVSERLVGANHDGRPGPPVRSDVQIAACRALGAMGSTNADKATKKGARGSDSAPASSKKRAHEHSHKLAFRLQNDRDGEVRLAACHGLGCMGEAAADHADSVATRLEGGETEVLVREAACSTLAAMGEAGAKHVALVAELLTSEEPSVRRVACETLGKMGARGADYAVRIAALAEDSVQEVRECATQTLLAMSQQGSEAAAKKLASDDPHCRIAAIKTLRLLKKDGLVHIHSVMGLMAAMHGGVLVSCGENKDVVVEACLTLGAMSRAGASRPDLEAAANIVAVMLDHVEASVRVAACEGLAAMRQVGAKHVDKVAARLGGKSFDLGWGVEATLEDADGAVRAAACQAIASMGKEALAQSANDLKKLVGSRMGDADMSVRKAAEIALRKITETEEELMHEQSHSAAGR